MWDAWCVDTSMRFKAFVEVLDCDQSDILDGKGQWWVVPLAGYASARNSRGHVFSPPLPAEAFVDHDALIVEWYTEIDSETMILTEMWTILGGWQN